MGSGKKSNTQEFIEKAREIHGEDTYDYSKTVYVSTKEKVLIICHKEGHGEFWQTPNCHTNGTHPQGCPPCGREKATSKNTLWTKEKCIEEGLKYSCKEDFRAGSGSAYSATFKNGWVEEVCGHMADGRKSDKYKLPKKGLYVSDVYPDLIIDPEFNNGLIGKDFSAYCGKKVIITCPRGHQYPKTCSALKESVDCTICNIHYSRSKAELRILFQLQDLLGKRRVNIFPDKIEEFKVDGLLTIESRKIIIEYDGNRFHKDVKKDKNKNKIFKKAGYEIIRIREIPLKKIQTTDVLIKSNQQTDEIIKNAVIEVLNNVKISDKTIEKYINASVKHKSYNNFRKNIQNMDTNEIFKDYSDKTMTLDALLIKHNITEYKFYELRKEYSIQERGRGGDLYSKNNHMKREIWAIKGKKRILYESLNTAAIELGLKSWNISSVLNGRQLSTGGTKNGSLVKNGYKFKYA